MKRNLLSILVALLPLVASANPSDTNPTESLYGEWWLVGWNDKGTWFEVDTNYVSHRHLSIEIPTEGRVMAYSIVNEIFVGNLTLNGNEMFFTEGGASTAVYADVNENMFFEEHICDIKSYQLEENQLRLYYTDEDYFVFTNDFDDSEEHHYEWKNGPADPYISEVTAMNDEEVEVKIVQCPSYVTFYSRTTPPRSNDICRFAMSDLAGLSFEVGDKVAFLITMFKRQKVEKGGEYQLKVEPIEGSEHITNRTGKMHNDSRMGWIIIDNKVNGVQGGIYYYPLRKLAEEYMTEGVLVKFSGELYPTWKTPWDNEGHSDCYYLSIDAINTSIEYFPEGTNWTEIRLDTLKYDSWYSKVDGEWVPNFETIEYRVQGEYDNGHEYTYKCVYTNGPEWTDSLTLLIMEGGYYGDNSVSVSLLFDYEDGSSRVLWPAETYQFDWSIGKGLYCKDIMEANSTSSPPIYLYYGIINEIKEGDFGGVRPLKYVDLDGKAPYDPQNPGNTDTKGARIIQGIGVTEWNDGECLFGPVNPYFASCLWLGLEYGTRHYRSMLVHFERNNEVLYNVWPEKETEEPVSLPFLEDNPIWVYKYEHIPMDAVLEDDGWNSILCWLDAGDLYYSYYFLGEQKEIEGKVYTMMGEVGCNREGEITLNRWLPVREENGIVYAFTDSLPGLIEYDYLEPPYLQQGKESVLYNFSADIGETLYPQNEGSTVKSFGTYQMMDGTECRVLKTTDEEFNLYEKLGYLHDQLTYGVMDPPSELAYPLAADVYVKHLNSYYQDNTMLYKAPDAQKGLCVNDTCWTRNDAYSYASSYKANPYHEKVMSYIRQLQGLVEPVFFTEGQMATIILPVEPDASKGKYYRLDRVEDGQIIFEQELQPQAHVPYIIVPSEDFNIDPNNMGLEELACDTVSIDGVSFIGSYVSKELNNKEGFYIDIIDTTPDCQSSDRLFIGALRAYLQVNWDDPYNHGGMKGPEEKMQIILRDYGTGLASPLGEKGEGAIYDLQGRLLPDKPARGIYIENRKKKATR